MNIAFKKTMPFALAAAIAVSGGSLALVPGTAMADTQGSTVLSLRAVDNPFNAGADQRFTINEGEDLTLSGDITGGFGDVTYRWYVSSDGGEHWNLVEGAHGTSLDLKNMKAGEYIYRLVASDMYSNTAHQDFYVTVKGNGIADSVAEAVSNAVKTGDSLPIAGVAGIAVVAAGAAGIAAKKRRDGKEDAR